LEFERETKECIEKSEFKRICEGNGINQEEYERILDCIAEEINRITEETRTKEEEKEKLTEEDERKTERGEKSINIRTILSNSQSEKSESNKETTTEESSESEEEIEEMALNIIKAPTFGGEVHENPNE